MAGEPGSLYDKLRNLQDGRYEGHILLLSFNVLLSFADNFILSQSICQETNQVNLIYTQLSKDKCSPGAIDLNNFQLIFGRTDANITINNGNLASTN